MEVKILKNLVGEFVGEQTVREATQKEYNQKEWNKIVERYIQTGEVKFFKTPGTIYEFDYYAIYTIDGIRMLKEISYSSCLSSARFVFGFYTEGCKNEEMVAKLKALEPEIYKNFDKDQLTILGFAKGGRISPDKETLKAMRKETKSVKERFFTNEF